MPTNSAENLVWMDLEMTGLEPDTDQIIEIATVITDSQLNIIAEGPVLAITQSLETLEAMDEWNTTHHSQSGLWDRVLNESVSLEEAEKLSLDFIKEHCDLKTSPLCGNSIGQDRRFLYKYMPTLSEYLHYRNVDVSTIKELSKRWYPDFSSFKKAGVHRALDDILESINELKYYKDSLFKD
jgi:oligoribonuclease